MHVLSPCGVFHLSLPVTAHSEQFPALLLGAAALHVAHCKVLRQCECLTVQTPHLLTFHCTLCTAHRGGSRAVQRCSISARSEPFQRLLRTQCRAWLSSAVQTSEMHASDDKVCSANSLNQIHCRASLRCLQMAPVFKWTTFSNPRQ